MPAELRSRLLEAAEQEIAERGIAKASLRSIARRCDVSHQATAHHFRDRAGLFTALAVKGSDLLHEQTLAAIRAALPDGGQQVAAGITAYVAFALNHPALFDVMSRPELVSLDDPDLLAVRERARRLSLDTIRSAQQRGWGVDMPAEEVAVLAWATAHGLAMLRRDAVVGLVFPDVDLEAALAKVAWSYAAPHGASRATAGARRAASAPSDRAG